MKALITQTSAVTALLQVTSVSSHTLCILLVMIVFGERKHEVLNQLVITASLLGWLS